MGYEYDCSGSLEVIPPLSTDEVTEFMSYHDTVDDPDAPASRYCPFAPLQNYIFCGGMFDESPREWITYLVDKFFAPRGHVLNGRILVEGEDNPEGTLLLVRQSQVEEFVMPSTDDIIRSTRTLRDIQGVLESDLSDEEKLDRIGGLLEPKQEGIGL